MAHAYTTKRGKNKKSKLGIRKDNQSRVENRQGLNTSSKDISALLFADSQQESIGKLLEDKKKQMIDSMRVKLLDGKAEKEKSKENDEKEMKPSLNILNAADITRIKEGKSESLKMNEEFASKLATGLGKTEAATPAPITPSCGFSSCPNISSPASSLSLRTCSACLSISYCSGDCQKGDWQRHKSTCKIIKKMRQDAEKEEIKGKTAMNISLSGAATATAQTQPENGSTLSVLSEVVNKELFLDEENLPEEDKEEEGEGQE